MGLMKSSAVKVSEFVVVSKKQAQFLNVEQVLITPVQCTLPEYKVSFPGLFMHFTLSINWFLK